MASSYPPLEAPGFSETEGEMRPRVIEHPHEEGVFILERPEGRSIVRQGMAFIGGAAIKYTYEQPEAAYDPVPLLLVPGYGGIKPAYRELRKAIVQHNKPAVTFRPPRNQKRFAAWHPRHLLHPERLLAQSTIAISRELTEQYGNDHGFEQLDTAGHSMGGPAVINAALIYPELFRTVTAMAAAGLDGHTLIDMGRRAPGVVHGEILPSILEMRVKRDYRAVRDIAHYVGRSPWRTAAEGLAVGSGDIRRKVELVGKLGVKTAALQFPGDNFFPLEGVRERAGHLFHVFRVFPDEHANHMWPQLEPESVAHELVDVIEELTESKRPLATVSTLSI